MGKSNRKVIGSDSSLPIFYRYATEEEKKQYREETDLNKKYMLICIVRNRAEKLQNMLEEKKDEIYS